ncbi:cysteine desulfurase family protein [Devosia pacifica]|nr:aminotransferase class V-fold PLP-dependent enzyme [Devosia pacifica]
MTQAAIYLDHNAAAPLLPEAREAMLAALELTGNPSSIHAHGRSLRHLIETARSRVAGVCGAVPAQVVFTASATEAITQAVCGSIKAFGVERLILSAGEHAATTKAAASTGVPLETIALDGEGRIELAALRQALALADEDGVTALVCVHSANNETGVVQPIGGINSLVGPTRHFLFVDAVQALGKQALDFAASAPDMMAVSGHKIGGIAGAAALLLKSHADTVRLIPGGGQEQGRRGGTEAVPAIAAFGAAAEAIEARFDLLRVSMLTKKLEAGIERLAPDTVIFGRGAERIGNTVAFAVPGVKNTVALMALDLAGVSISSGSACSSGKVGRSHVLDAMGVAPELSEGALRVSLGWSTTDDDIEGFLAAFSTVLSRRRKAA